MKFLKNKKQKQIFAVILGVAIVSSSIVVIIPIYKQRSEVEVTYLGHSGFLIQYKGKSIYFDPYLFPQDFQLPTAEGIFITHPHYDHLSSSAIKKVEGKNTQYILPESVFIRKIGSVVSRLPPNSNGTVAGFNFTTIPMYNLGNSADNIHLRSNDWCSYLITINGFNILHVGDSDDVPELYDLSVQIDLAFLPIATYSQNMGMSGAVNLIKAMKPSIMVPMHFWGYDPLEFQETYQDECPETEIHAMTQGDSFFL
jgi:L-ascorbate metabolism protein UlaG (beta-lactamase superfamily)